MTFTKGRMVHKALHKTLCDQNPKLDTSVASVGVAAHTQAD
jgi:hypothetical protein